MKKWISSFLSLALVLVISWAVLPQKAEAAWASGAGSLYAGDTVTVTFSVSGDDLVAVDIGSLDYSSDLSLIDYGSCRSGWDIDRKSDGGFLMEDTKQANPINGSADLFYAVFQVSGGAGAGATVSASVSGIWGTSLAGGSSLGGADWSASILAPLSGNNYLSYITCSNGTLEPAFDPDIREYSMTVPYEVDSLALDWGRDHSASWVDVSGNSLSVGSNTISLTVTAENGSTRTYYIYVTRQEDPNYVPNTDATLSGLSASTGTISPAFDPAKTDYVVYVPYEVETIQINGTASDAKAKGVTQAASDKLQPGDNLLEVICTAEDGKTTKTYQIHVVRMPAYAGALPEIKGIDRPVPASTVDEKVKDGATMEIPLMMTLPLLGEVPTWAVGVAVLVLVLLALFLLAWFWGRHSGKKKILKNLDSADGELGAAVFTVKEELENEGIAEDSAAKKTVGGEVLKDASAEEKTVEEKTAAEAAPASIPEQPAPADALSKETQKAETTEEKVPEEAPAAEVSGEDKAEEKMSEQVAAEVSAQMDAEKKAAEKTPEEKMSLTELLEDIHNM